MLAIGSGVAPQRRRRRPVDRRAVARDAFAVALQCQLLQKRREARERLRIRNHNSLCVAERTGIPPADQPQDNREIFCGRRFPNVRVHRSGAGEERVKCFVPMTDRDRQTDGRPKRIAAAHAFPEGDAAAQV